jgi:hypothetical protein
VLRATDIDTEDTHVKRLLFLVCVAAFATDALAWQQVVTIIGTVTAIHERHLAVKDLDGTVRHVTITTKTRIVRDSILVTAADIKTEERVTVRVVETREASGTALVAEEVQLGTAAAVSKPATAVPGHHDPSGTPAPAATKEPGQHEHGGVKPQGSSWHFMQDGVAFLTYNNQGGPRGSINGGEYVSQNWWMGMAQRPAGGGTLQLNLMLSLEPATVGEFGYREIFQVGETLSGFPLIDHQHPHDFLMQAAVVWRVPLGRGYRLTLAGAPVGEPALGPVAFMHRSSSFENPTAPLAHHTLDSTHIAMGVLTAAVERGPFEVETSLFRGREPDEQRWDLMDPGALDSWSVRGWYRPNDALSFQLSHGFLTEPEPLEEGNVRRTTASASWIRRRGDNWTSSTLAYGRNDKHGASYDAVLAESTHVMGRATVYGRAEVLQVETDVLRFGVHISPGVVKTNAHEVGDFGRIDIVETLTLGGVYRVHRWRGWDIGAGGDVTFYGVPEVLKPTHGDSPVSFHAFIRIRPPAPMGRMHDMLMTKGMH